VLSNRIILAKLSKKKIDLCIDKSLRVGQAYFSKEHNKIHIKGYGIDKMHIFHEIGHWAMLNDGNFAGASQSWSGCGAVSAWGAETTPLCAFLEGWADFFATELGNTSTVMQVDYSDPPQEKGPKWKGSVATYLYRLRTTQSLFNVVSWARPATTLGTINLNYCDATRPDPACNAINEAKLEVGAISSSESCSCDQENRELSGNMFCRTVCCDNPQACIPAGCSDIYLPIHGGCD
jgi:hypothetical protein